MAPTLTATDTCNEYLSTMGAELGPIFYALYNEFAWLHLRWHQSAILFATKPERIDLLNAAAGLFFRVVQDNLWEQTLLHISRMTDQPEIRGTRNLTIRLLPALVPDDLKAEVSRLIDDAVARASFAKDWRNRHIAHSDLALAIGEGVKPLAPASLTDVKASLDAIAAVLNRLESHYRDGTIHFEPIGDLADAESLLFVLRDGIEAGEARRKRLEAGTFNPDDLKPTRAV